MTFVKHLLGSVAIAAMMANLASAQETDQTDQPAETPSEEAPADPSAEASSEQPEENSSETSTEETTEEVPVTAETVLATVNGTDITVGHMIVMAGRLPSQYQQLSDDVLFPGLMEQLIQQAILAGDMSSELSKGSQLALENETRSLFAGEKMREITEGAITDEAIQAKYEERYANAEPEQEFSAAHILVETEEEAAAIKAEIEGGADFADVAREKSTGPSGPNGGDLGWFGKGMMVEPFEEAVLALEAGQVSNPVQTQFGWHIIKLNEVRTKEAPPLEQVRAELQVELQQNAIEEAVAKATETATIIRHDENIDPAVIRNFDLLEN